MYQKTQDRGDYLDRVASHATKGSGRGTVWWKAQPQRRLPPVKIPPEIKPTVDRLKEALRTDGVKGKGDARRALTEILRNLRTLDGKRT